MAKIKLTASSDHSISFAPTKIVEVDDEEWADMGSEEREAYAEEEARMWRETVVNIEYEIEG